MELHYITFVLKVCFVYALCVEFVLLVCVEGCLCMERIFRFYMWERKRGLNKLFHVAYRYFRLTELLLCQKQFCCIIGGSFNCVLTR